MKNIRVFLCLIAAFTLTLSSHVNVLAQNNVVETVLSEISFTEPMCTISEKAIEKTYGSDTFRLPFFNDQLRNPLETPSFFQNNVDFLLTNQSSLRNLTWYSSYRLGYMVAAYPQYEPNYDHRIHEENPLLWAIADIYTLHSNPISSYMYEDLKIKTEPIPVDLQKSIAGLLYASMEFSIARDKSLANTSMINRIHAFRNPAAILTDDNWDENTFQIASTINYSQLYFAGVIVSKYLDTFLDTIDTLSLSNDFSFEYPTPLGCIIIQGTDNHTYTKREVLLCIDKGGDDTYLNSAGGNDSYFNPVSICIDLNGNDTYKNSDDSVYSQGAGVFGYGALIDLQGNDSYKSNQYAQGFGCFGIGILSDRNGQDFYSCDYIGQGSGVFGIGVLQDSKESDLYEAYSFGQGFGYVKGYGLLIDDDGNDIYIANDEDIAGTNPQSSDHNTSFCQGAGFGRRADLSEGNSMSGGIGMLVDNTGDDTYSCGVFGQGTGYWAGTGVLFDGDGNDSYKGIWYVQGGAAHFGIALLLDNHGNDTYDALMNMAQGAGHDVSIGFLIDQEGNDTYTSPNLALGGGNANGLGFFVDGNGNDTYQLRRKNATNLGKASCALYPETSWRYSQLTLGLFIDRNGEDSYLIADEEGSFTIPSEKAKNNSSWSFIHETVIHTFGCGIDTEGGEIPGLLPLLSTKDGAE